MTITNEFYEFKARDGMSIFGDIAVNSDNSKEKIIIMLPGLTGIPQQFMFMALRDRLINEGCDIFIANVYSSEERGGHASRSLLEINMQRHIEDFNDMAEHFKKEYKEVYAIGHSLAGRVLLLANNALLKKQILLDPSGNYDSQKSQERLAKYYKTLKEKDLKYIDWQDGLFYLSGKLPEEMAKTPFSVFVKAVSELKTKSLFVSAGKTMISYGYQDIKSDMKWHITIENAGHCFYEYGVIDELTKEILEFLKK